MVLAFSRARGVVVLLALAAVIAIPFSSAASEGPANTRNTLEGRLVVLHGDDFDRGSSSEVHAVMTDAGTFVETDVTRLRGVDKLVGSHVTLGGALDGSTFTATGSLEPVQGTTMSAAAGTTRQTAVILINFTNDGSQPWTPGFVANTVFGATNSVAAYYREVSYGTTSIGGPVLGWYTIPYDNSGCRYSDWGRAALSASGIDPNQYAHIVYAFPRTLGCTWAGLSTVGGKYAWINGFMTLRTVAHELAHTMGVHHASALKCTTNGTRVTFSSTCTRSEYGDPFSIMGLGTRHLHHGHRAQMGWLPETITVTASGEYSISPAELTAQPRLVRVARGEGTYLYFELRQPYGTFDTFSSTSAGVKGVSIRIAPDKPMRVQSLLLDMTPGTTSFEDAPLAVGRSFTDPTSGVTVTTVSVTSTQARVTIRFPGTTPPPPSATPTPSTTPTPSGTPSPSPTPSPSSTPSPTPSATPSPTATPTPSASPIALPEVKLTEPPLLTVVRLSGRDVRVKWGAAGGPVVGYRIYREGVIVGTSSSLRLRDHVPRRMRWPTYVVRAFDQWGNLGPRSKAVTLAMPST